MNPAINEVEALMIRQAEHRMLCYSDTVQLYCTALETTLKKELGPEMVERAHEFAEKMRNLMVAFEIAFPEQVAIVRPVLDRGFPQWNLPPVATSPERTIDMGTPESAVFALYRMHLDEIADVGLAVRESGLDGGLRARANSLLTMLIGMEEVYPEETARARGKLRSVRELLGEAADNVEKLTKPAPVRETLH